ncbi:hypothetical protein N9C51_03335, partial [Candidatus Pelagibacter sp.]|nr:hypothetical protein [Candidatus Pelagibacter sp.]
MKKTLGIVALGLLWFNVAVALPKCTGKDKYAWSMCEATLLSSTGKYVGEWRLSERHGQGTFTSIDGSIYIGEWLKDKRDGQGTFTYPDGS